MTKIDELQKELEKLRRDEADKAYNAQCCSVCGLNRDELAYGHFEEVRVLANPGEEGHADVKMFLCDDDAPKIFSTLYDLGFKDHDHHGTNWLSDRDCVGESQPTECPEYDRDSRWDDYPYVVGQNRPVKAPESPVEALDLRRGHSVPASDFWDDQYRAMMDEGEFF